MRLCPQQLNEPEAIRCDVCDSFSFRPPLPHLVSPVWAERYPLLADTRIDSRDVDVNFGADSLIRLVKNSEVGRVTRAAGTFTRGRLPGFRCESDPPGSGTAPTNETSTQELLGFDSDVEANGRIRINLTLLMRRICQPRRDSRLLCVASGGPLNSALAGELVVQQIWLGPRP
jgi:hypothetical protein